MIPSLTPTAHGESHGPESALGAAGKKKADANPLASLFASLLGKAKASLEGNASKDAAAKPDPKGLQPASPKAVPDAAKLALEKAAAEKLSAQGRFQVPAKGTELRSPAEGLARTSAQLAQSHAETQDHQALQNNAKNAAPLAKAAVPGQQAASGKQAAEKEGEGADGALKADAKLAKRRGGRADASSEDVLPASAFLNLQGGNKLASAQTKGGEGKGDEKVEGADSKKKDKRRDRLELEVYDQRTPDGAAVAKAPAEGIKRAEGPAGQADLSIVLKEGSGRSDGSDKASSDKPATNFADALAKELRENANGDIVQRASMVLRDGGEGTIRLALKPDTLGEVKIKLDLTDNKIAGRIVVESDEALRAFTKEIKSLEQAFLDGGFDGASIELALSSGNGGQGSGAQGGNQERPYFSDRLAARDYGSSVPDLASPGASAASGEQSLVDMIA